MGKKTTILTTLKGQRDDEQSDLNGVSQDIAESEGELTMAEQTLESEQSHLASTKKSLKEATEAYDARKKDRDAEGGAVKEALAALSESSFIQRGAVRPHVGAGKRTFPVLIASRQGGLARWGSRKSMFRRPLSSPCDGCAKVAAFLRQEANVLHSSLLSAAAATSMSSDAIDEVIDSLKGLIKRIDDEHKTEKEHKEWCEDEISDAEKRRDNHASNIESLKQEIASLDELIDMKQTALDEKEDEIDEEKSAFERLTDARAEEKSEYEEDLEDHNDAIQALNEAIDILSKFYASRKASLLQTRQGGRLRGGVDVVEMVTGVRKEFEVAKDNLIKEEETAVTTFNAAKDLHTQTDDQLHKDKDVITSELQTAEQSLEAAEGDLESNKEDKKAAQDYLKSLGKSCYPLLSRFDERKKLREEEKAAIKDAIKVLRKA